MSVDEKSKSVESVESSDSVSCMIYDESDPLAVVDNRKWILVDNTAHDMKIQELLSTVYELKNMVVLLSEANERQSESISLAISSIESMRCELKSSPAVVDKLRYIRDTVIPIAEFCATYAPLALCVYSKAGLVHRALRYQGGKKRYARELYSTISLYEKIHKGSNTGNIYAPFFGMGAVELQFAHNDPHRRIRAVDKNCDVIEMWRALQSNDWLPDKKCSMTRYNTLLNTTTPSADRGFYLAAYSFGGVFGNTYRGQYQTDDENTRQGLSAYNAVSDVVSDLDNIKFYCGEYDRFTPQPNEIVYCDPPYNSSIGRGVNKYLTQFDTPRFWDTMRLWSKKNLVFISEEDNASVPLDFVPIWSKSATRTMGSSRAESHTKLEALYIHERYVSKRCVKITDAIAYLHDNNYSVV